MTQTPLGWLRHQYVPVCLLLVISLAPLVEMNPYTETPWLSVASRALLLQSLFGSVWVLLGALAVGRAFQPDVGSALSRGPHPFLIALLLWCALVFCRSPYPSFAVAELLRVVLCLGVYILAAYGLRPDQVRLTMSGVVLAGVGMAACSFLQFGAAQTTGNPHVFDHNLGLFGDNENLGSFLMLLLPLALQPALSRDNPEPVRLGAQAASLILLIALVLSGARAAWIGGIYALMTMGTLLRQRRLEARWKFWVSSSIIAATLLIFLLISNTGAMVVGRALSLVHVTRLTSFTDRLHKSAAACRAVSERPIAGWGLGTWPIMQRRWTHEGDTLPQVIGRQDVWSRGGDQQSLAHDFWVQWAAETGGIGLCLYVAAVAAFFLTALSALSQIQPSQRKGVLVSCIATVAGSCVDAVGAPSYNFPGVSVLPWLCMGLAMAACRGNRYGQSALPTTNPTMWGKALFMGAVAAILVLVIGFALRAGMESDYKRHSQISEKRGSLPHL